MERIKKLKAAIAHYQYGISHDIFSDIVREYAKLAVEALEKELQANLEELEELGVDKSSCINRSIVTELQFEQTGETSWGEPIGYEVEVPLYDLCMKKEDYADCKNCKEYILQGMGGAV